MATAPSGKWIDGVASNDKTSRVARKSLAERLRAVRRSLSRSARSSLIASESVHQLRVAARRAVEGLKLYADFVPRRRAAWITKQMKKLRKAAGPARDCDVLISRLKSHTSAECPAFLIEELQGERRPAERAIVAAYRRLRKDGRFGRRTHALVSPVRP